MDSLIKVLIIAGFVAGVAIYLWRYFREERKQEERLRQLQSTPISHQESAVLERERDYLTWDAKRRKCLRYAFVATVFVTLYVNEVERPPEQARRLNGGTQVWLAVIFGYWVLTDIFSGPAPRKGIAKGFIQDKLGISPSTYLTLNEVEAKLKAPRIEP